MSEFNKNPIDIVIPWCNSNDEIWKQKFEYWKQKETGNKDTCRYSEWGFIKYALRSIDQNCPWCRYVFLILSSPSQIPVWLNVNHPKLKIVYHKDYIPEEYLPTFNSNVIEMFLYNIDELSDNYISCNDDMFFSKEMPEKFFFNNDKPVCINSILRVNAIKNEFWDMLVNDVKLLNKTFNIKKDYIFWTDHLPVSYNKTIQHFLMEKINEDFKKSFINSKFRQSKNLNHFIFNDLQIITKNCILTNNKRGLYYGTDKLYNINFNVPLLCINEGELSKKEYILNCIEQLEKRFKKCSFEL